MDWRIGGLEDWGIWPCRTCRACRLVDLWIEVLNHTITNPPMKTHNLKSTNPSMALAMGRRKRYRLRRTESASSAGGERRCRPRGQSLCGRRDCADAVQARRRGRCSPQIRARQASQHGKLIFSGFRSTTQTQRRLRLRCGLRHLVKEQF